MYLNRVLESWVQDVHSRVCELTGSKKKLIPGHYSHDTMSKSVSALLNFILANPDYLRLGSDCPEICLDIVHTQWKDNWMFWVNEMKTKPGKPIDTKENWYIATRYVSNLPPDRLEIYTFIISTTLNSVRDHLLLQSMTNLQINK